MERENLENPLSTNPFSNSFIRITVTNPQKVGTFITSFVTYRINSSSILNQFQNQNINISVTRRFNDFIMLYEKLHSKYAHVGRIIPPPPEKNFGGMLSVMITNEADVSRMEFIEKRRAALERFLNRLSSHKIIKDDIFFKLFLESKTSYKKTVGSLERNNNLRASIHGLGLDLSYSNSEEDDIWFQRKCSHLESYQEMLEVFSEALHQFIFKKKEIGEAVGYIGRRVRMISNYEEDQHFSSLLFKIAEGHKDLENVYMTQPGKECDLLVDIINEYIAFTNQAKEIFTVRAKAHQDVRRIEKELDDRSKKELNALQSNTSRSEISKYKRQREQTEERFERYIGIFREISRTVQEEVTHFEQLRIKELRAAIRQWISNSANVQEQVINVYREYLNFEASDSTA